MKKIIRNYSRFLKLTSDQYASASQKNKVKCKRGCYECCTVGFFDITLLDALHLRESLKQVPPHIRKRVLDKANEQLDLLEKKGAFSREDPLLKSLKAIDSISRRSAKMSCPALNETGGCLIYEHRPHICRIFGPTIRGKRRAVHLEGCGYFTRDIPEADFPILSNYKDEEVLLKAMFTKAGKKRKREVDTIIPAALTLDLKKWL
ncbi:MAG: YkgJ family cysteine cluster protein [Nitrospirota bacterium]|nr:YkgJ family cysteine cluster protein [Nitrospirota bacterium]